MPRKLKLVVSDFHLGRGRFLEDGSFNTLEEFFYDHKFIEFLDYHMHGPFEEAEIELIFNGDFFNHLQVDPREESPELLTEKVAIRRTWQILQGHPEVFAKMKEFAAGPARRITFLLGNHDAGFLFPAVPKLLKEVLGERTRVILGALRFDGVHVEHGHQFFADNAYNPKRYFLTRGLPEPVVNLPWGSYFVIHYLNKVKQERPYFGKIYPFKYYLRWALIHEPWFAIRNISRIIFYFVWLRFRRDKRRRSSFLRSLRIIKEVPISPNMTSHAKRILLTEKEIHTVIFSHSHHAVFRQFSFGKTYLNTGLWNEQISLEISDPGKIVRLTYAHLEYDGSGSPHASLKEWKGEARPVEEVVS